MKLEFLSQQIELAKVQLCLDQLNTLEGSLQTNQPIYKVELDSAKDTVKRLLEKAFDSQIKNPVLAALAQVRDLPETDERVAFIREAYYNCTYEFHRVTTNKKLLVALKNSTFSNENWVQALEAATKDQEELQTFFKQAYSTCQKGRKPSGRVAVVNPNKIMGTCSCCFRSIARDGKSGMALHGYRRLGGAQSSSCAGVRWPCLEESLSGLEHFIALTKKEIDTSVKAIAALKVRTSVQVLVRNLKTRQKELVTFSEGEPEFEQTRQHLVYQAESELNSLKAHRMYCEQRLIDWKAFHKVS